MKALAAFILEAACFAGMVYFYLMERKKAKAKEKEQEDGDE